MPDPPPPPAHADLVADLRVLRERGLIRLRRLELPALAAASRTAGLAAADSEDPRAMEDLLRRAVGALGDEEMGTAAGYLFGLVRGTLGWSRKDRRERAASHYHLSAESFRKEPEQLLIGRVADEILRLCDGAARHGHTGAARPAADPHHPAAVRDMLLRHVDRLMTAQADGDGRGMPLTIGPVQVPVHVPGGRPRVSLAVHQGLMEELRGIQILVSSENTFLETAKPFKSSLSAHLRRAAAVKNPSGAVVTDVVETELKAWLEANARPGLPVEAGCVAPTSAGRLARRGVVRIYHAAIASPRPGTNDYDVDLAAIPRAVGACLELGRLERARHPHLRSLCFPLFGAGRAGIDPAVSFSQMWPALCRELAADPSWEVHVCTRYSQDTVAVLRHLYLALAAARDEPDADGTASSRGAGTRGAPSRTTGT